LLSLYSIRARGSDSTRQLTCRVKNPAAHQALETSKTMRVYFPPQAPVIMGLKNEEVKAGSFLRLVCMSYGGNPLATLHWTKLQRMFSYEIFVLQGENSGMMTRSNLAHKVSREDNGLFLICEAFNKGTCFSRVRAEELTIYYLPQKVWLDAPPPNFFLHSVVLVIVSQSVPAVSVEIMAKQQELRRGQTLDLDC
ncbi:hypothetical protein cypCar_00036395, partial [Cyprinus carpio]